MKRYFEFIGEDSSRASGQAEKFWEISLSTTEISVRFGKIGAKGQTTLKAFPDAASASREAEKLIAEKIKKGYVEIGGSAKPGLPSKVTGTMPESKLTECIACAEEILSKAKLCKHCGTMQNDPAFAQVTGATKSPSSAPLSKPGSKSEIREATETELDMMSALILIWNPEEFGMDDDDLQNSWNLSKADVRKIQKWQQSAKGDAAMFALLEQIKSGFLNDFNEFLDSNARYDTNGCRGEIAEFVNNQDFSQSTKFVADIISSLFEDDPKTGLLMFLSFNDFEDWLEPKTWAALNAFLRKWWHQGASHLVARVANGFTDPISQLPY